MPEDILDRLKEKEDEMESLINEARGRASLIREEAARRAKEIKNARLNEIDSEVKEASIREEEHIRKEVFNIEEEARSSIGELRRRGAERKGKAVKEVIRYILEGIGDKGDEEAPDNRAEGVSR